MDRPDLPPPIMTSDPGSFAMRTIVERKPRIVAQVREANDLPAETRAALDAFVVEMREGRLQDPWEIGRLFPAARIDPAAMERAEEAAWREEIAAFAGRPWLDLPWYFAEAFFYLRVLAACGYFAGSRPGADPFAPLKRAELTGPHGGLDTARGIGELVRGSPAAARRELLLMAALWGNRVDLSNYEIDESRRRALLSHDASSLVVDHVERARGALSRARDVHVVLDNAGPELVSDLLLAEDLAAGGARVTLHAKRMPFFVSDATIADVAATVGALGGAVAAAAAAGRIAVTDHWFWSGPRHFTALPADLRAALGAADVVVVKGDANYRRMLEDRRWEPWRSMDDIARAFPAPFVCLRTMKAEIVVDVPREKAAALDAEDPGWLTNGRRGIVRYCEPRGA